MKKVFLFLLFVLMLFSAAYSESKDPFYKQTFRRAEVGNLSFLFPETWKGDVTEEGNFTFKAKSGDGTKGGLATISLRDVSSYGDPLDQNLLDTIYPTLASEIKSSGRVTDFTIYFAEHNDAPVYYANYYLTIRHKKHPTAVVLYIQDGDLISFTLSDEAENLDTVTNRAIAMFCTMEANNLSAEPKNRPSNIYDNAIISQNMSVVYADSSECTDEVLADWYFNHIVANGYNWGMILYTDKDDNSGVYGGSKIVEKNVTFRVWEDGSYSKGDNSNATIYIPDGDKLVVL